MRMKLCPFCAEPIQAAAVICKHCQRDVPAPELAPVTPSTSRKNMIAIWGIVGLVLVTLAAYSASTGSLTAPSQKSAQPYMATAQERQERVAIIQKSQQAGLIQRVTCAQQEAQVSLGLWLQIDADFKKNLTMTVAAHCHDQGQRNRIAIVDAQSGRELARFDNARGYSVK